MTDRIEDRVTARARQAQSALAELYAATPEAEHPALAFGILTAALADHIHRRGVEETARASLSALAAVDVERAKLAAADAAGSA